MSNFLEELNNDDSNYLDIQSVSNSHTQPKSSNTPSDITPYLLPSDITFLQLLKDRHGIEITHADIRTVNELHFILANENRLKLLNDPNSTYVNVQNGRVLGVLAFAAIGFFAFPALLGTSALAGALIGAAIGWRLFGGKKDEDPKSAQTFGFDSAPALVPIGGVVPLIFCNRAINPNGGVRTSGTVLFSRVDTWGGVQTLLTLYSLCLGEIGYLAENEMLINGQPRTNFFADELLTSWLPGTDNQPIFAEPGFENYSQTITTTNNNLLGHDKRGRARNNQTNSTTFEIRESKNGNEFDRFVPGDRYLVNGQNFRLINRNVSAKTVTANAPLTFNSGHDIFATYEVRYTTSKKCAELHLNFAASLWGRDKKNRLLNHAVLADIFVDDVRVGRFFILAKSETTIRRRLIIANLPYATHKIRLVPLLRNDGTTVIGLGDNKTLQTLNTGFFVNGKQVILAYEGGSTASANTLNNALSFNRKQSVSSERSAPVQLTTVAEVVKPSDLSHSNKANYTGLSFASLQAEASVRLQGDPNPSFFVYTGIIGRCHAAAGFANVASTADTLADLTTDFSANEFVGKILRNLDKQTESLIIARTANTITTAEELNWSVGDRYLIYYFDSLVYFPDIYVYTLANAKGGLGAILPDNLIEDFFIDYVSVCRARDFCKTNNYFWDGIINEPISWTQWATRESLTCLLYPTRFGGKFGLIPEQFTEPVALFNASNMSDYTEDYAPRQRLNAVHITYRDGVSDGDSIKFREKTVSVLTTAVFNGTEPMFAESVRFDAITNEAQAIRVAQIMLKSRLLQQRVISFKTGLQGFGVTAGDLIVVQHITTEVQKEMSGFVKEVEIVNATTNRVQLSVPLREGINSSYSAAIYRTANGTLQRDLPVSSVVSTVGGQQDIKLQIEGLTAPLNATRDNLAPDYVTVSLNQTERRIYRISSLQPNEDGSCNVTAALWTDRILSLDGMVTIGSDNLDGVFACGQPVTSGGQSIQFYQINLTSATGNVIFNYKAFTIPDQFEVIYDGETILNTGYISGSGSFVFAKTSTTVNVAFVRVTAELGGTAWNFSMSCPQ